MQREELNLLRGRNRFLWRLAGVGILFAVTPHVVSFAMRQFVDSGQMQGTTRLIYEIIDFLKVAVLVVEGTFVAGTMLYIFRCRQTGAYGVLEIFVGAFIAVAVASVLLGLIKEVPSLVFGMMAALYVIVRGFDNIYRSYPVDAVSTKMWNLLFFGKHSKAKL